jgi:drug/metabolite transporter (DMT)-like permease
MKTTGVALLLSFLARLIHDNHVSAFPTTVLLKQVNPLATSKLHMSDTTDTTTRIVEKITTSSIGNFSSETLVCGPPLQVPVINALTRTMDDTLNPQSEYQKGLLTIGFITLLFSSNSPVLHAAFSSPNIHAPPVLLLNAAVSVIALVGLLLGGDSLESKTLQPFALQAMSTTEEDVLTLQGGCELGLWKFLGTTANLYGLTLTTAGHGALLIQLTTLIVPLVQGIQGVPIPRRIQVSVILALAGVVCFTQDLTGTPNSTGDALCVLAAVFYATYDLRLFAWGKRLAARRLITTKIGTQATLSVVLLLAVSGAETMEYITSADSTTWSSILPVVVWSGVAVNAVAPFLQVGGQQTVGPTRCQTIYASQPLWAAILSFMFLGETIGTQGLVGGTIFLVALFMAATAKPPDADCGEINCEI